MVKISESGKPWKDDGVILKADAGGQKASPAVVSCRAPPVFPGRYTAQMTLSLQASPNEHCLLFLGCAFVYSTVT